VDMARLSGHYHITFITLKDTYGGSTKFAPAEWVMTPRCKVGPCPVHLVSKSGHYEMTLAYTRGRYVGVVNRKFTDSCGSYEEKDWYSITPVAEKFVQGAWVVTRVDGKSTSSSTGGTCLPASSSEIMHGVRV
jgi:hypothetical protein